MKKTLRIGTRASLLALTQSGWIKSQIEAAWPGVAVELARISTKGDRILDTPLAKVGGKGLFVKEIEDALLSGDIDLAVHSMKDVPALLPDGLHIGVIPAREAAQDAFVSLHFDNIAKLPNGARVGTSSLRRKAQLAHLRPDLQIFDLRGNIDTRLRKLDEGGYDAILLAAAGLRRLGMGRRITQILSTEEMLPAVGQGALGIELRLADEQLLDELVFLHDEATATAVSAERAFLARLEGGCQVPIAAHAVFQNKELSLAGLIASVDGMQILRAQTQGQSEEAAALGRELAEELLSRGGKAILEAVYGACLS